MNLSPDNIIFWQMGYFKLNATIVYTWGLMLVLVLGSKNHYPQTVHGTAAFTLAESAGDYRHRH